MIKECFSRDEGWGWNLPKMHVFAKTPLNMLNFGSVKFFFRQRRGTGIEGNCERPAEKTQKQQDKFAEQCSIREYESDVSNIL
jgi:hypothetical protein